MTSDSSLVADAYAAHRSDARGRLAAGAPLPQEFLLAAACCRWPPSEARNAAIRATAEAVDWNLFLRLIRRQRIVGFAQDGLSAAAIAPPAAIARELAARAEQIARQHLILSAETVRLCRLFEAAQIPVLVLKGVALARLAYGTTVAKQARDIDLLVPLDRAESAWTILEGEGYVPASLAKQLSERQRRSLIRYDREAEFVHPDKQLLIELQWRTAGNPALLKGVGALSPAQNVTLSDGTDVRTLAPDDLFAYLCVHGAQHAWSRLKWIADVNALIVANEPDIAHLYRHAQWLGAGLCAGQALALCRLLFDLQLPPAVADEIAADRRIKKLTAIALDAISAPHARTPESHGPLDVIRGVRMQFLLGRGWAFFVAQCRVAMVGPADVVRCPLPPALHFLYPLLRLPLWLWRRARLAMSSSR